MKKEFGLINLIIVIVATAIVTSLTTGLIIFNNKNNEVTKISNDKSLQEFITVYNSILNDYYEDVDKDKMIDKAIESMLDFLGDDYTTYMNEDKTKDLAEKLAGKYEGIGVEISEGNRINQVFENSPAEVSGLKIGDVIVKVNDKDVTEYSTSEVAAEIKSLENIVLVVNRDGEELSFNIEKKELYVPAIDSEIIDAEGKKIGYIYISTFSNTVYEQFRKELEKIEKEGIDSLIIDVRNNTGGYLKAAHGISSIFIKKGKVIYSLEGKKTKDVYKDETNESKDYPIVVLINETSASASEILAAALNESYGATLVGKKSYGKGKVQQTATLKDGNMYKYTSARWLTPSGNCIDKKGIKPDYEVDLQIAEDGNSIIDTQYDKAIEVLQN